MTDYSSLPLVVLREITKNLSDLGEFHTLRRVCRYFNASIDYLPLSVDASSYRKITLNHIRKIAPSATKLILRRAIFGKWRFPLVRELTITGYHETDLAKIAQKFPNLETLTLHCTLTWKQIFQFQNLRKVRLTRACREICLFFPTAREIQLDFSHDLYLFRGDLDTLDMEYLERGFIQIDRIRNFRLHNTSGLTQIKLVEVDRAIVKECTVLNVLKARHLTITPKVENLTIHDVEVLELIHPSMVLRANLEDKMKVANFIVRGPAKINLNASSTLSRVLMTPEGNSAEIIFHSETPVVLLLRLKGRLRLDVLMISGVTKVVFLNPAPIAVLKLLPEKIPYFNPPRRLIERQKVTDPDYRWGCDFYYSDC